MEYSSISLNSLVAGLLFFSISAGALLMLSPHSQEPPSPKPLRVGDRAPDFTLKFLNSDQTFTLSHNFGKKPTVLIFGSYT
jgi:hypothetical protein